MSIPNTTHGGSVHSDRRKKTEYNQDGTSRSKFADQPSSEEWIIQHDDIARQCTAIGFQVCNSCGSIGHQSNLKCMECSSSDLTPARCTNEAVDGKMTCSAHGGTFKPSPQHLAATRRGSLTTGLNFNQIMLCPCKPYAQNCPRKNELQDADGVERCIIEQEFFDALTSEFIAEYDLTSIADLLILQRLGMAMIKIQRGERNLVKFGDLVERSQAQPNGTVSLWMEANPSNAIVNSLDATLKGWLKELAATRAARSNLELTNTKVDIARILSGDSEIKTIVVEDSDD